MVTKRKKVPPELKAEVEWVFGKIRQNEEVREVGTKLISVLKSEFEGRGHIPEEKLDRRRKVFNAMLAALED